MVGRQGPGGQALQKSYGEGERVGVTNGSPEGEAVVIYARVSSGHREKEETVQTQLADVRAYAARQGYRVVAEYVDEAYSGTTLHRPRLDAMREAAANAEFDRLLVWKIDRLARSEDASPALCPQIGRSQPDRARATHSESIISQDRATRSLRTSFAGPCSHTT